VILVRRIDDTGGALFAVGPVMVDPGLSENLLSETARPLLASPIVFRVRALLVMIVGKGMRAGAQGNDRFAAVKVIDKMFHLLVRKFAESQGHHTKVRRIERRHPGNVGQGYRVDCPIGGVNRKQDRALETVAHGQNLRQHREALF